MLEAVDVLRGVLGFEETTRPVFDTTRELEARPEWVLSGGGGCFASATVLAGPALPRI